MALTPEQLKKLPPSVAALLRSQAEGNQALAPQTDPSAGVMTNLQGALGRRFGETKDFDQQYDQEVRGLMGQVPGLQSQFATSRQRADEDFGMQAENIDKMNTRNREQHLNQMADRGIGFSGANLVGQGRIAEQFQQGVQGLGTAHARGMGDLATSEADAYRRIQSRVGEVEGAAAERGRVRDEKRKWEAEQARLENERVAREVQQQEAALARQQEEQRRYEEQLRQMESMALAQSQPMPTPTGGYASAARGGGGGGGGARPTFDTNTNVSVEHKEYNLRDPREIRELQRYLGLRQDGVMGPATAKALADRGAVAFNDRPINTASRYGGVTPKKGGYKL